MKKRIFWGINILLFMGMFLFCLNIERLTDNITVLHASGLDEQAIIATRTETEEDLLDELLYNGARVPYDSRTETFYISLDMYQVEWESGILYTEDEEVAVTFAETWEQDNKKEAIAKNKAYMFYAYDDQYYKCYSLVFGGLPMLHIDILGNYEQADTEGTVLINTRLYKSGMYTAETIESLASLRVRGGLSRNYPKLGYRMELLAEDGSGGYKKNKESLLDMRKDDEWILHALYADETKVRDKLSIDIWNSFGSDNDPYASQFGTRMEYVELFIGDEYMGIYGLLEPIDSKQLAIAEPGLGAENDYIYKKMEEVVFTEETLENLWDGTELWGYNIKGRSKYDPEEKWTSLKGYLGLLLDMPDEVYEQQVLRLLDLDNIADYWLFVQIISGVDNRAKNMYLVERTVGNEKKLYCVPWDMDLTWGNTSSTENELLTAFDSELEESILSWNPGDKIIDLDVGGIREIISARWNELRSGPLQDENLIDSIDGYEFIVNQSGAMYRDQIRWPDGAHTDDYSRIKEYAVNHMKVIDYYIEEMENN